MIALVLAAAVAASQPQLTPEELDKVIASHVSPMGLIQDACYVEQTLLSSVEFLQRSADQGYIGVMDRGLQAKLNKSVYFLNDKERNVVETRVHELQTEAKIKDIDCRS